MGLELPNSNENRMAASEPAPEETHAENPLVDALHNAVLARIRDNRTKYEDSHLTMFHALKAPAISLRDYIARLLRYTCCSQPCFASALMYLDRAAEVDPALRLDSLNVHRLLITSVMIAAKFWDDTYFVSSYYARVGGVPTAELNSLELEFLLRVNFRVSLTADAVAAFEGRLVAGEPILPKNCAKLARRPVVCSEKVSSHAEDTAAESCDLAIYPRRW